MEKTMEDEIAPILDAEPALKKKMSPPKKTKSTTTRWQERLLPTMIGLLVGLTLFFFAATFVQMAYLHWSILQYPSLKLTSEFGEGLINSAATFDEQLSAQRAETLTEMEAYIIGRRYHLASVELMAGLWIRYLGFITGMILALVGASFVLGKLREPSTELTGKASGVDFSLKSASPGIILAVLGVILMFATIINKDVYLVQDYPVYLQSQTQPNQFNFSTPNPVSTLEDLELLYGTPTPVDGRDAP
jgi:hypothetical protein